MGRTQWAFAVFTQNPGLARGVVSQNAPPSDLFLGQVHARLAGPFPEFEEDAQCVRLATV